MKKYRFFLLIFIFLIFQIINCHAQDKEIAWDFFTKAETLFESDKVEQARKLLLSSLEFYPNFSES